MLTYKTKQTKKCSKKQFTLELLQNALTLYLHQSFERNFEEVKEIEILKYAEDWDELQRLFVYSENRGQNL